MKNNEKLIPTLIEEDKNSLPIRRGNYVSEESIAQKKLEKMKEELNRCNCDCDCNCNCNCDRYCDCDCNC